MKVNQKYKFCTAAELAELLLCGNKKSYDFTFDTKEDIMSGFEPSGWYAVKLLDPFDSGMPDCLAIGYYGGGDSHYFNLGLSEAWFDRLNVVKTKLEEFFAENNVNTVCTEVYG